MGRSAISGFLAIVGALTILGGLIIGWHAVEPWLSYDPSSSASLDARLAAIRAGLPAPGRPPFDWFGFALGFGTVVQGVVLVALAMILSMVLELHAKAFPAKPLDGQRRRTEPSGTMPRRDYFRPEAAFHETYGQPDHRD